LSETGALLVASLSGNAILLVIVLVLVKLALGHSRALVGVHEAWRRQGRMEERRRFHDAGAVINDAGELRLIRKLEPGVNDD
jgi:sensor domain CHASE-containing protein